MSYSREDSNGYSVIDYILIKQQHMQIFCTAKNSQRMAKTATIRYEWTSIATFVLEYALI
jgi:hypothetical protein